MSISWFKTIWLTSTEREILRKGKEQKVQDSNPFSYKQPFRNALYSQGSGLTVVFWDGSAMHVPNADMDMFEKVQLAQTEDEIKIILTVVDKSETDVGQEKKLVTSNLDVIKKNSDFVVKVDEVYLKGVNLAIPAPITASFIELLERKSLMNDQHTEDINLNDQLQALKMFWLKLALNPLPQSREDLLVFVRKNDVRITRNGNLILYRRIVSKTGTDNELVTFVTQNYYNVKKNGLDPREYAIAKNIDGYILIDLKEYIPNDDPNEAKPFCNLQQMYLELPTYDENTFTASHDRSVEIKLGGIYKIPDNKINLNNSICAAGGLHAAAVDYNYSGFGDIPVVVLVNPSKAITVPVNETGKLRTIEMFVACVNDKPLGTHFDESALGAFDTEYHDLTLGELEEAARKKSFENLSVKDNVPAVSLVDLDTIKKMLKDRVKQIV